MSVVAVVDEIQELIHQRTELLPVAEQVEAHLEIIRRCTEVVSGILETEGARL